MMLLLSHQVIKKQGSFKIKMKSAPVILLLALGMSAPAWASASRPACTLKAPDVRNLMSVNEYRKTGLDKLTKQQVKALNAWLARYTRSLCPSTSPKPKPRMAPLKATTAPAAAKNAAKNFGQPPSKKANTTDHIVSHIAGEFHGWTGRTRFRLTNGQVWVQAGPGYYETDMKSPKVIIKKLLIGYIMQVDDNGKEVFVRRIH